MIDMQPTTRETISGARNITPPDLRPGLRAGVAYAFLILALCLMIVDFCRLIRA
jgi:hypothetical protein